MSGLWFLVFGTVLDQHLLDDLHALQRRQARQQKEVTVVRF